MNGNGAAAARLDPIDLGLREDPGAVLFGPRDVRGQRAALRVERAADVAVTAPAAVSERFAHSPRRKPERARAVDEAERAPGRMRNVRLGGRDLALDGLVGAQEALEIELGAEASPAREDVRRGPHHHHVRQGRRSADARSLQDEHVHPGVHLEAPVLVKERDHLDLAVVHLRGAHVRSALDEEDRAPGLCRSAGHDAARRRRSR